MQYHLCHFYLGVNRLVIVSKATLLFDPPMLLSVTYRKPAPWVGTPGSIPFAAPSSPKSTHTHTKAFHLPRQVHQKPFTHKNIPFAACQVHQNPHTKTNSICYVCQVHQNPHTQKSIPFAMPRSPKPTKLHRLVHQNNYSACTEIQNILRNKWCGI